MAQVPERCPKTRARIIDRECPHPPETHSARRLEDHDANRWDRRIRPFGITSPVRRD